VLLFRALQAMRYRAMVLTPIGASLLAAPTYTFLQTPFSVAR